MSVECFVTGGSGFVGQHLLAGLTAQGHKTWVLMRSPGNIERLKEQVGQLGGNPEYIHAVEGDISQEGLGLSEADKERVTSAAVFFHLAAQFSWGLTPERARTVNVQGAEDEVEEDEETLDDLDDEERDHPAWFDDCDD